MSEYILSTETVLGCLAETETEHVYVIHVSCFWSIFFGVYCILYIVAEVMFVCPGNTCHEYFDDSIRHAL